MVIKTSEARWFHKVCLAYREQTSFTLIDDAKLGINPELQSALEMGVHAGLNRKEILACFLSLGMSGGGAAMIVAAILDPEPTSSLALLIGGGVAFVAAGGFSVLRMLTKSTPTNISVGRNGFGLSWGEPAPRYTDIHNYPGYEQPRPLPRSGYGSADDLRPRPMDGRQL